MAAYGWRTNRSVSRGVTSEGHLFDFFQAVRLLEIIGQAEVSVGEGFEPAKEKVRFKSNPGLGFPASDIQRIEAAEDGLPAIVEVNFLGLTGVQGPLPRSFAEEILTRKKYRDHAAADFLDIFNHRLVSLLYRARKRFKLSLHWGPPETSRIAQVFFAFIGLHTPGLRGRMRVRDRSLLGYAGLLARQARTMVGLRQIVAHYFGVAVELRPLQGKWHRLSEDQWTRIGTSGSQQVLGQTAVLGTRCWDQTAGVELGIGPLDFSHFRQLLPIGRAFEALQTLIRFYTHGEFDFSSELTLEAKEVPELRLGRGSRLGWTTWLKTREFETDDSQVRLTILRQQTTEEAPA